MLWYPTHLYRVFGIGPAEAGFTVGIVMLTVAPLGTFLATMMTEHLARRGQIDAPVRVLVGLSLLIVPGTLCSLVDDFRLSLVLFSIMAFCQGAFAANVIASIQFITPSRVRGLNSSIYMLVLTLGALGIGTALVGGLSDWLDRPDGLRYAMAIIASAAAICAVASSRYALGRFRAAVAKTGGLPEA
jgi:MFS family permease